MSADKDDFDPLTWSMEQVRRHGDRLAKLMNRMDSHDDGYQEVHACVGQLAQVYRALGLAEEERQKAEEERQKLRLELARIPRPFPS